MNSLGDKIKALRKELRLTQADLAGSTMTNSMLSQIENGVSQPSMKTLQYLASRLNKPVSYFIDDVVQSGKVNPKTDDNASGFSGRIVHINELIESNNLEQAKREIEDLIAPGPGTAYPKLLADILLKGGLALAGSGEPAEGERYIRLATEKYSAAGLNIDAAKSLVEAGKIHYFMLDYQECGKILDSAFEEYEKAIVKDPRFEVELYYYKIMLYSATGKNAELPDLLGTALKLSADTGFFYKSDELYRLRALFCFFISDREKFKENINLALKFAEFNRNKQSLMNIHLTIALEAAEYGEMEKAEKHNEISKGFLGQSLYLHHILTARILFSRGKYREALEAVALVTEPGYIQHKLDYLIFWSYKADEGLILHKLGRSAEGIAEIKKGIEKMEKFGSSRYLADAWRALGEIHSENRQFEKAYSALKTADALRSEPGISGNTLF